MPDKNGDGGRETGGDGGEWPELHLPPASVEEAAQAAAPEEDMCGCQLLQRYCEYPNCASAGQDERG
jgi:hypothetical protein